MNPATIAFIIRAIGWAIFAIAIPIHDGWRRSPVALECLYAAGIIVPFTIGEESYLRPMNRRESPMWVSAFVTTAIRVGWSIAVFYAIGRIARHFIPN